MQTIAQKKHFIFIGTIQELRFFLRTLPPNLTLAAFIAQQIH